MWKLALTSPSEIKIRNDFRETNKNIVWLFNFLFLHKEIKREQYELRSVCTQMSTFVWEYLG